MHIPERMCVACRKMKPKSELIRIAKDKDAVKIGSKNGRGAYICRNPECIGTAKKRRALSRHFKQAVPDSIYDDIVKDLNNE